mmetsp:Transcript_56479/g.104579  ORF Transcript_56479/g.104579 Transcript_56479/m.104579 type:complete len:200 (+) Transcript_56479:667-1266(+)
MKPAAGVTVASPAIAPTQRPTNFGRPSRSQSMINHMKSATEAAISEFTAAATEAPLTFKADPPLKPNQPNHNNAVPSATNGMLWGVSSASLRLPTTTRLPNAENPAVMCTTMPPAKSHTPHSAIHPPPQTQWQKGAYTKTIHNGRKMRKALNLNLSAKAPVMRTGVITANMPWYAMKRSPGMSMPLFNGSLLLTSLRKK